MITPFQRANSGGRSGWARTVPVVLAGALALAAAGETSASAGSTGAAEARYLVVFSGNDVPPRADAIVDDAGGALVSTLPSVGLGIAASTDPAFAGKLRGHGRVADVGVEPRFTLPTTATSAAPSAEAASHGIDPEFWDRQWNIRRVGAPEAWDTTTGSHDVVVAVIDSGVAWNHPDLAPNVVPTARSGGPAASAPVLPHRTCPASPAWCTT